MIRWKIVKCKGKVGGWKDPFGERLVGKDLNRRLVNGSTSMMMIDALKGHHGEESPGEEGCKEECLVRKILHGNMLMGDGGESPWSYW